MKWFLAEKIGTSIRVKTVDLLSFYVEASYDTGIILSIKNFSSEYGYKYLVLVGDTKIDVERVDGEFFCWDALCEDPVRKVISKPIL